jgi:hypothetical protein
VTVDDLTHRIAGRLHSCVLLFDALAHQRGWPAGVYLNRAILENAVEHYFRELGATKALHAIERADAHKRASFTLKWISRLRPVQIERGTEISKSELMLTNEVFAVFLALEHLQLTFDHVDDKWLYNLLHTLRYRDFDAEAMASEMYLIEQAAQK